MLAICFRVRFFLGLFFDLGRYRRHFPPKRWLTFNGTWRGIPEGIILPNDRCENLKFYTNHDVSAVRLHKQMAKGILVSISFCVAIGAFATKSCKVLWCLFVHLSACISSTAGEQIRVEILCQDDLLIFVDIFHFWLKSDKTN
jgi:hypothetical protein